MLLRNGWPKQVRANSSSPLAFTASPVKPAVSSENRAPENGPAAGERLAGPVERSLFLSPRRTERSPRTCPRRRRRVGAGTLWSATGAPRPDATCAANPRKQGRKRRSPRGSLLEGFCETNPSEFLRRERLAPALVVAHQPVRTALRGTGSLRSHRPENANLRESKGLSAAVRNALSRSHRPATNAGADHRVPVGRGC